MALFLSLLTERGQGRFRQRCQFNFETFNKCLDQSFSCQFGYQCSASLECNVGGLTSEYEPKLERKMLPAVSVFVPWRISWLLMVNNNGNRPTEKPP
jgi:hypothetical protein